MTFEELHKKALEILEESGISKPTEKEYLIAERMAYTRAGKPKLSKPKILNPPPSLGCVPMQTGRRAIRCVDGVAVSKIQGSSGGITYTKWVPTEAMAHYLSLDPSVWAETLKELEGDTSKSQKTTNNVVNAPSNVAKVCDYATGKEIEGAPKIGAADLMDNYWHDDSRDAKVADMVKSYKRTLRESPWCPFASTHVSVKGRWSMHYGAWIEYFCEECSKNA